MTEWFNHHQDELRLFSFFTILIIMAVWEWQSPSRPLIINKINRWTSQGA